MAGPAIRAVELSRVLAAGGHPVVLAAPAVAPVSNLGSVGLEAASSVASLRALVDRADVVVAFSALVADHPWLGSCDVMLIVDAYDPGLLETLERRRGEPVNAQRDWTAAAQRHLVEPLRHADVVLVASERQRHLIVGMLAALGRLGPRTVAEDPALTRLVAVVPFGTPPGEPPSSSSRPLTGPEGLVGPGKRVALWGGGLYDWLDPLALVEAMARTDADDLVAVFLAGPHPTPAVGRMALVDDARARARDLGLLGRRVVFHEQWVPYDQRIEWLGDAAMGVSLHHRHVETEFAFRTRILDYLWARLPVVCSDGDHWSTVVRADDLGRVVVPGDVDGVARALDDMAGASPEEQRARAERAAVVAARHAWPRVAEPLLRACAEPRQAADRRVGDDSSTALSRAVTRLRGVAGAP
jgi:glycosyltransferase involved in cell wall biosynthesis